MCSNRRRGAVAGGLGDQQRRIDKQPTEDDGDTSVATLLITHKYRGSQQFLRVEYSTQIYWFDTRGAKEHSQLLAVELSIQLHLDNLVSVAKYLVAK